MGDAVTVIGMVAVFVPYEAVTTDFPGAFGEPMPEALIARTCASDVDHVIPLVTIPVVPSEYDARTDNVTGSPTAAVCGPATVTDCSVRAGAGVGVGVGVGVGHVWHSVSVSVHAVSRGPAASTRRTAQRAYRKAMTIPIEVFGRPHVTRIGSARRSEQERVAGLDTPGGGRFPDTS